MEPVTIEAEVMQKAPSRRRVAWNKAGLPLAVVFLSLVFGTINRNFFTASNLANVARQTSILAIASVGQTMVILTGGVDLSQGSVLGLVSVVASTQIVMRGIAAGMLTGLLLGLAVGIVHGMVVAHLGLPAFIVTMGTLSFLRGAAFTYTNGMPVTGLPNSFALLGSGSIYGVPVPAVLALLVFVIGYLFLTWTKAGRYLYAIGGNEEAAFLSGINIAKYKVIAYCFSGTLAGLAGLVLTSRVISGQPTLGETFQLESVAAAVIGGTSLKGGEGGMVGTFFGVLLMAVIGNGLNLVRVSSFVQMMVIGAVIIIAVAVDTLNKRSRK